VTCNAPREARLIRPTDCGSLALVASSRPWLSKARHWTSTFNQEAISLDITSLLIFLAIGAVAGWLAGTLMKGGGFELLINIILGIVGAVAGGFVFGLLEISADGLIGSIITATVGAVVVLYVVGLVKKA